jgi:hypothetical protein
MSPGAGRSGQNSRDGPSNGPSNGMPPMNGSYENAPFSHQLNMS